ncbi:MAG: HDIG domain-containing protein, partial [Anaerolineales bacterium]|nr:HDIG domain-containing protein [Anaerolineales bacterium]
MKTIYTSDLKAGDEFINELFLLQDVTRRTTKDGRPYLLCTLRDNAGQAGAVFWNVPEYIEQWTTAGTAVLISGRVVNYKDTIQVNITDMNPGQKADLEELLPASLRSRDEMIGELRNYIASVAEPWRTLLTNILLDDAFLPRYANAPAARAMHHAYISGLLEHTLSMTKIADLLAGHYPYVNRDLLIAGVLLHDVGKTHEYEVEGGFAISEDGRLVGHIVRAIVMVEQAASTINFPPDKLQHLVHLIA